MHQGSARTVHTLEFGMELALVQSTVEWKLDLGSASLEVYTIFMSVKDELMQCLRMLQ